MRINRKMVSVFVGATVFCAGFAAGQPRPDSAKINGTVVFSSAVKKITADGEFLNVGDATGNFASIPRTAIEKDKERRAALKDDCLKLALFSKATGAKFIVIEDNAGGSMASSLSVRNCSVE